MGHEPICALAYLGSLGIAEALRQGADMVICGRVSDAAPTVGLAAWWHNWSSDQFDELAGALIAGHLIECSVFVTGGYYSRFKDLMAAKKHLDLGFPIAEVFSNGECRVAKEKESNGIVNIETVTSQLVYEISGPLYFNSDVVASVHDIKLEQISEDYVHVSGVKGLPPPDTTRVGVTAHGGYQAEWHFYLVGLDIEEKCQWMEEQARHAIGEEIMSQFTMLKFQVHGTSPADPANQEVATVDFRIFAQGPRAELFDGSKPDGFARKLYETVLQSCPGVSRPNDLRQSTAKSYWEYFVTLIPQAACCHRVHLLFNPAHGNKTVILIPLPPRTSVYGPQESYDPPEPFSPETYGPTVHAPLGTIALARSGDKASDANVGLFVSHDAGGDVWQWLRTFLTIDRLKQLLGPHEYSGGRIDRFELENIRAVHFLLKNHLDRGYNSGSKLDTLAKNLGEYLRAKHVPVPVKFLATASLRPRIGPGEGRGHTTRDARQAGQFSDKVIAVTGAAQGIGYITAVALAERGASLSLADVQPAALAQAKENILTRAPSTSIITTALDVRREDQVSSWIAGTVAHFGRLNGAANIAGVVPRSIASEAGLVEHLDADEWEFVMGVNATGVMYCMKHQLSVMRGRGCAVVNAASIAGLTGRPRTGAYAASKHAVVGLTRSAAKEVGERGVRVNAICPGRIDTPMSRAAAAAATVVGRGADYDKETLSDIALRRKGQPEEVADLVCFLLSDESSYITGNAISIDGGWNC
ncbi:uncharacterized protein B0I36DRAFT_366489 [Microdochium trichocladiopsis]|uniref:Ketoreductase domain-containing protein n=1 Tax=Microdochium trichocladiopsis TaxID=1682393 RepID=A0A9P9BLM2_9PEZI|nr:uncharacterized protein B0I36DRAFT_366489 [Microdochium trichocladiopsis]KAH7024550.1 hypothetical protein B0I36DRAFT_366489 [Microdochium trichocladiopsis]